MSLATSGIYKITNIINGKCYIGQSVQVEKRWNQHKNNYKNCKEKTYNSKFYRAIRKYGINNFEFSILEECSQEELNEKEKFWIKNFNSFKNGYNMTLGGDTNIKVNENEYMDYFLKNNPYIKDLANVFNIERATAGRILKRIDNRNKSKFYVLEEEEKNICNDYLEYLENKNNLNCTNLSKKYNRDIETVSKILKKNNIIVKRHKKPLNILIYSKNGNFLFNTNTVEFLKYIKENTRYKNPSFGPLFRALNYNTLKETGVKQITCYGYVVRYYKNKYPKKINIKEDFWGREK